MISMDEFNTLVSEHINEVTVFFVATSILLCLWAFRQQLEQILFRKYLFYSFLMLFIASFLTIAEHAAWPDRLNTLEHIAYTLNSLFLMLWCRKVLAAKKLEKADEYH